MSPPIESSDQLVETAGDTLGGNWGNVELSREETKDFVAGGTANKHITRVLVEGGRTAILGVGRHSEAIVAACPGRGYPMKPDPFRSGYPLQRHTASFASPQRTRLQSELVCR